MFDRAVRYRAEQDDGERLLAMADDGVEGGKVSSILEGKRAVVIEDEGVTQLQMRRALTQAGMKIAGIALNARAGTDVVLKERPDIVLMDITMPGDIDGLDAAAAIMATYRVCIVVVTAYNYDQHRWRAQSIGTCGYLVKPISTSVLLRELEQAYRTWSEGQAGG